MKAIVQRVKDATLSVDGKLVSELSNGLLVYLGITHDDTEDDIKWLVNKIANMRIFGDEEGKMNLSATDLNLGVMVVSQFTLYASTKKGNRPSYLASAKPPFADDMYEEFKKEMTKVLTTVSGIFGADMKVRYINDGPVTIPIDSKLKV